MLKPKKLFEPPRPKLLKISDAFDEEPPLLRVERLVGRQIDYRGIDFRLAEVRIDRRVEDQSALDRGLEVDAERAEGAGAVVEGIAVRRVDELLPRRQVGRDLQPPPRMDAVEPREVHHPRGHAAVVLRPELEPDRLVLAVDEAGDVDAPGLLRGFLEAQLRERDPQLRRPACVVVRDPGAPHRVPRIVPEVVIGEHAVSLHTGGADRELHAGAVIVARIQVERDAVGVGPLIASGQSLRDRGRLRVEHPRAHVERVVVVEEADLGALRRRLAFIRIALPEVVRRRRLRPYLIVQASVDRRGSGDSECLQRGSCRVGRRWLSGGYGRLLRVHRRRCPDHCRRQQEQGAQVREVHRTFDYRQAREEPRASAADRASLWYRLVPRRLLACTTWRRLEMSGSWGIFPRAGVPFDSRPWRSLRALSRSGTQPATSSRGSRRVDVACHERAAQRRVEWLAEGGIQSVCERQPQAG